MKKLNNMEKNMLIPSIHVGCGNFALERLQIVLDGNQFSPVACVDIDLEKARSGLRSLKGDVAQELVDRVYTTISEAKEKNKAEVCFIFVSSIVHAKLIEESLGAGLHTFCVKAMACNKKEFKDIIKVHKTKCTHVVSAI